MPSLCEHPYLASVEQMLRREIYRYEHFSADRVYLPYIPVEKVIQVGDIGIQKEETTLGGMDGGISAHAYKNQITCLEDIEKLHSPEIFYDETETKKRYELLGNILADILPVKQQGVVSGYSFGYRIWDEIAEFMGVNELLMNLVMEEELMHKLAEKMADIFAQTAHKFEELGVIEPYAHYCHSASALTRDLPPIEDDGKVRMKNVWGRGLAQILGSVSPQMHADFDIAYAKKVLAPFGLVYYGCCEPLDKKIDILRDIPNLRKISITPWADIEVAADAIGKDYVLSVKPTPASVAVDPDEKEIRKELEHIASACKKHGCSFELLLKDISTIGKESRRLELWERIAMDIVKSY